MKVSNPSLAPRLSLVSCSATNTPSSASGVTHRRACWSSPAVAGEFPPCRLAGCGWLFILPITLARVCSRKRLSPRSRQSQLTQDCSVVREHVVRKMKFYEVQRRFRSGSAPQSLENDLVKDIDQIANATVILRHPCS